MADKKFPKGPEGTDATWEEVFQRITNQSLNRGGGEGEGSETDGEGEGESTSGGGDGSVAQPVGGSPEYIPIPGGQIRIYRDENGVPQVGAVDGIDMRDGETRYEYGRETAQGPEEISELLSRYSPQPTGGGDGGDTPAGDGTPSDPGGQQDGGAGSSGEDKTWLDRWFLDPARNKAQNSADTSTAGRVAREVEEELEALGQGGSPLGTSPYAEQAAEAQKEVGWTPDKPGVLEKFQEIIADDGSDNPPQPPGADPMEGNPSPTDSPRRDPTDINPTSQVNLRAWDMFDRGGATPTGGMGGGSTSGTDSGTTAGATAGPGSGDVNTGGRASAIDQAGGWQATPFPSGGAGSAGGSSGGSGSSGGNSASGSSGGGSTGGAVGGATGSTGGSSSGGDGAGGGEGSITGTVIIDGEEVVDEEGNPVVIEFDSTDTDSDDDEPPGVATSEDPTGESYQPTPEDLERAMAYQNWLRGSRTPIDPQEGGYSEYRGDGSGEPRWGRPGVDQPGPVDDEQELPDDPGGVPVGGNQGGYTDPSPLDDSEPQAEGAYTDDPLADPRLGGTTAPSPAAGDDGAGDQPLLVAVEAEVTYGDSSPPPPPPGGGYIAIDPNDPAYQQPESEPDPDIVTNRYSWDGSANTLTTDTNDFVPLPSGGSMPDRSDGSDDDPFDLD